MKLYGPSFRLYERVIHLISYRYSEPLVRIRTSAYCIIHTSEGSERTSPTHTLGFFNMLFITLLNALQNYGLLT